jgi:hypothetical protein
MNIKIKESDLIYAYKDSDLLSIDDFIAYCSQRDIVINDKDLEFYEKRKLVIPVDDYSYSIYQIYPIYWIKLMTDNHVGCRYTEYSESQWITYGQIYEHTFEEDIVSLYEDLKYFAKDRAIIIDLNTLAVLNTTRGENAYIESLKQTKSYKDAIADFSNAIKLADKDAVPELNKILEKHKINTEYLIEMQKKYIGIGGYQDPARKIYPHIINIDYFDLMSCRGKLKFALESYGIAENISWAITALGKTPISVTETLLKVKDYRICANPTCQKRFIPKKEMQFTCGNKDCTDYYRNLRKRQKRIPTK